MEMSLEQKIQMLKSLRGPQNMIYYAVFPLGDMLLILFLTLKLGQWGLVAGWDWKWVLSPFWIPLIAAILKKFLPLVKKYLTLNEKKAKPIVNIEDLAPEEEAELM